MLSQSPLSNISVRRRDVLGAALSNPSVPTGRLSQIMWENLRIRERERKLGVLFMSVLPAVFGYGLLATNSPGAAGVVGILFLGIFWLFTVRRLIRLRQNKYDAAPVGPLSHDERLKARSKLLKSGSRSMLPH